MQIEIKEDEHEDILINCLISSLIALKEQNNIDYLVHHNNDGTCIKYGIYEDGHLWLCKYTEDDVNVE